MAQSRQICQPKQTTKHQRKVAKTCKANPNGCMVRAATKFGEAVWRCGSFDFIWNFIFLFVDGCRSDFSCIAYFIICHSDFMLIWILTQFWCYPELPRITWWTYVRRPTNSWKRMLLTMLCKIQVLEIVHVFRPDRIPHSLSFSRWLFNHALEMAWTGLPRSHCCRRIRSLHLKELQGAMLQ